MSKTRKYWITRALLLSFVLFIVLFVSAEIYFRSVIQTDYGYITSVNKYDPELGFTFIPGGEYAMGSDTVFFNRYGYVDEDWIPKKDSSTYRIAMVGSCVLTGVFHIADTAIYNYPNMAEAELQNMGYNVEILNFGMPGESRSYYTFKTIEEDVLAFDPDLVLLENVFPYSRKEYARDNYLGYQLEYIFTSKKSKEHAMQWAETMNDWSFFAFLMDHSWVIKKLALKYQHTHHNDIATFIRFADKRQVSFIDDAITGFYTMEKSIAMTLELESALEKDSIDLKILRYKQDGIKDTLLLNSLDHIALKTSITEDMYYPHDDHFNNLGQLHFKEKFIEELVSIIPDQYKPNQVTALTH